jgi:hypothetical protein
MNSRIPLGLLLFTLCSTRAQTSPQGVHNSLYFSDGHSVQRLQVEGAYIIYQYASENGQVQRKGQVRISDLDLVDVTVGGGSDVFGVDLRCKNGSKCLDYSWVDARVRTGDPVIRGTNSANSIPLSCKEKEDCTAFLAALRNIKGDDYVKMTDSNGTSVPEVMLKAPLPLPAPTPPTIDEVNLSNAISTLGALIPHDNPTGIANRSERAALSFSDPRKQDVRNWLTNRVPNMEEFRRDRELWEGGFKRLAHPTTSTKARVFIDRFYDLFDLWDRKR